MAKRNRAGKTRNQADEFESKLSALDSRFDRLEDECEFNDLDKEVDSLETDLRTVPQTLAKLRKRGYAHKGHLEEQLQGMEKQWRRVRREVRDMITDYRDGFGVGLEDVDKELERAERRQHMGRLKQAEASLVDLEGDVSQAKTDTRGRYSSMRSELSSIKYKLNHIDWIFDNLAAAGIALYEMEGPIAGVKAEWQRDGKEGPDGILYLTDQRIFFEQKEEVAKKKFLGLFTTESETVQELLIDERVQYIQEVKSSEEGGILGFGKDDILQLVFSSEATLTRARFHIKGEESSDWAKWIKQVQDGAFDKDRAETHSLPDDATAIKTFPANCPHCFAAVPPQPRGLNSVACEYCSGTINAVAPPSSEDKD